MQLVITEKMSVGKSIAEVAGITKMKGRYLFEQLLEMNRILSPFQRIGRNGGNWCLGAQPTAAVLLQNGDRKNYHMEKAPLIRDDFKYQRNPEVKDIRVYDSVDARMLLDDFYAKLRLCFGQVL